MNLKFKMTGIYVMACICLAAAETWASMGVDPTNESAWCENIGWANAGPTNNEVTVHFDGNTGWLSGHVWGENVGWIKMGADTGGPYANTAETNWGVNLAAGGDLSGYAWGANVGWINFSAAQCDAAINTTNGEFSGHAWGENIGWLKFAGTVPDYGVRTLGFDTQPQDTPNWWLDHHNVTESYDAGDGVTAWQKYVMDTDPNTAGDHMRITALSNGATATTMEFTPASTQRYYTLTRCEDLTVGAWSNVAGYVAVQYGTAGINIMQFTNTATEAFYRVNVTVTP